jgi:hypothetical protein
MHRAAPALKVRKMTGGLAVARAQVARVRLVAQIVAVRALAPTVVPAAMLARPTASLQRLWVRMAGRQPSACAR